MTPTLRSLNPCFSGIVVVEKVSLWLPSTVCLNPCFSGIVVVLIVSFDLLLIIVLILVLVE